MKRGEDLDECKLWGILFSAVHHDPNIRGWTLEGKAKKALRKNAKTMVV